MESQEEHLGSFPTLNGDASVTTLLAQTLTFSLVGRIHGPANLIEPEANARTSSAQDPDIRRCIEARNIVSFGSSRDTSARMAELTDGVARNLAQLRSVRADRL